MALLLDILSWLSLVAGVVLMIIGGVGLIRLPDLFARMHAAGIIDTLGMALVILGMMLQVEMTINFIKLVLILAFILFTSPTSTHALAKAALHGGLRPGPTDPESKEDEPSKT